MPLQTRRMMAILFILSLFGYFVMTVALQAAADFKISSQPETDSNRVNTPKFADGIRTAELFRDPKTGIIFDAPGGLKSLSKSYGTNWSRPDGKIQIDTLRYTGRDCLIETYENVRRGKHGAIALDQIANTEWLLAGREDSEAWWVRMVYRAGECRGLSVVISQELLSDRSIDLMRQITESFEPFPNR